MRDYASNKINYAMNKNKVEQNWPKQEVKYTCINKIVVGKRTYMEEMYI